MKFESLEKKQIYKIFFFFFLFLLLLTACFPYSGDDWAWGSSIGLDRLSVFFKDYNGRYVGNLLVLVLTRLKIFDIIFMSFIILGIVYFCFKIINSSKKSSILMTIFLFLVIPKDIFKQGVVWTSGFANYAVGIFLTLIYLYLCKDIFTDSKIEKKRLIYSVLTFLLALISGLFMENITIFNIIISLFSCIVIFIKNRKVISYHLSYFIGSICSAVIMFTNGAYHNIAAGSDEYRNISSNLGLFDKIFNNYFKTISYQMIFNNLILNLVIVTLLIIIVYRYINKNKPSKKMINILTIMIGFCILFVFYTLFNYIYPDFRILLKYTTLFEGIISFIYFCLIVAIICITIKDKNKKFRMLFILGSICMLTAPLLIVSPIGPRNFLPTYVLFIIFSGQLLDYVLNSTSLKIIDYLDKILIISIIAGFLFLFGVYGYIGKSYYERNKIIKHDIALDKEVINVKILPYDSYLWTSNPVNEELWQYRLKLFYGIEENKKLKFIK